MGERGSLPVTDLRPNLHSSALSPTQPPISPAGEGTSEASTQHTSLSGLLPKDLVASLVAQMVKHLPTMQETQVQSLGWKDPLEKEMATHSSTLAWKNLMDGGSW